MKNLFNEKGHLMLKYIINQIAMSFFGVMMAFTAATVNDDGSWLLPFGIFSVLFYWSILISFMREDGLKDAIKLYGGRIKKDALMPLKYCGIAAIPGLLFPIVNMIIRFTGTESAFAQGAVNICSFVSKFFLYGAFMPLDSYLFAGENAVFSSARFLSDYSIVCIAYTFLTLIVCFLAYNSGLNRMFIKKDRK